MSKNIETKCLKICLLTYRNDPFCGGQGVYIDNLSKSLTKMGHSVEIVYGPPKNFFEKRLACKIDSLDLYDPSNLFRPPGLSKLSNFFNFFEWFDVSTMGFPEPFIFGAKCFEYLKKLYKKYDVIHDNQCLSYGLLGIQKLFPTVITVHHSMMRDINIFTYGVGSFFYLLKVYRWYSFVRMQKYVAKNVHKIITVSGSSMNDIIADFGVIPDNVKVIYNGVDTNVFRPIRGIIKEKKVIITTCGGNSPIKGLEYLLMAVFYVRHFFNIKLVIVGEDNFDSKLSKMIKNLDIFSLVSFTGKINNDELVLKYNKSTLAVVSSVYEGFGFPAIEAMACGVPVIGTVGGALAEVIGGIGILVPPQNYLALSYAIVSLLNNLSLLNHMGKLGKLRVKRRFSWVKVAEKTLECYREVVN